MSGRIDKSRIDKTWTVLTSVATFEGERCVDFFSRPDGTFGFEEFRRDVEDRGAWTPVHAYSGLSYASSSLALEASERAVAWLTEALSLKTSLRDLLSDN